MYLHLESLLEGEVPTGAEFMLIQVSNKQHIKIRGLIFTIFSSIYFEIGNESKPKQNCSLRMTSSL